MNANEIKAGNTLSTPLPRREGQGGESRVVIELQNVKRYFQVGSETVKALRGVSFKIYEGEFVTIQGTSGSGKSTLLNNWAVWIRQQVASTSWTASQCAPCRRPSVPT